MIRGLALAVVLAAAMWSPARAHAHAVLVRATPPGGAALDRGPREISLRFSEAIAPGMSRIDVHDVAGRRQQIASTVTADGITLSGSLPALPRGVYTVRWRVLSAVDGHVTSGFYLFAVGPASLDAFRASTGTKPDDSLVASRWAAFLAAMILVGTLAFRRWVAPAASASVLALDGLGALLRRLTKWAAAAVLAAAGIDAVLAASALDAVAPFAAATSGAALSYSFETRAGLGVIARVFGAAVLAVPLSVQSARAALFAGLATAWLIGLGAARWSGAYASNGLVTLLAIALAALAAGAIASRGARTDGRGAAPGAVDFAAGILVLAGHTLNSHAAGAGWIAAAADLAHMIAGSVWAGALLALILSLARARGDARPALARALLPRYSAVATTSVAVLIGTGVFAATLYVPGWDALAASPYGQALRGKVALMIGMVALGAYIRVREAREPGQALLPALGAEGGLGVLLVGVAALLTVTPPAGVASPASAGDVPVLLGFAGDVRVQVTVTPNVPGRNRFDVVATQGGMPLPDNAQIRIRAVKLDEDLAAPSVVLARDADGRYAIDADTVGLPGLWELEVVVRRPGVADASTSFPLRTGRKALISDFEAFRWLLDAQRRFASVPAWREREQTTDGFGNGGWTTYEMRKPNRARFTTGDGDETVFIGADRYVRRAGGAWQRQTLPRPLTVEGPLAYVRGAQIAARGPERPCDAETCQVVLWNSPDGNAAFAGWIGRESKLIRKLMMFAPAHLMTTHYFDFGAPIAIRAP